MNNYISQLLEKLAEATANPTPETDFGETYEDFEKANQVYSNIRELKVELSFAWGGVINHEIY